MTLLIRRMAFIVFIICMALPAWSQQYQLYAPSPVTGDPKAASQDGVLVQEIEVQKGDTLYSLSRKYSGHGMYFPQILLFNSIKNPDLIYPGKTLKIPVASKEIVEADRTGSKPTAAPHKPALSGNKGAEAHPAAKPSPAPSQQVSNLNSDLSLSDLKAVKTKKRDAGNLKKRNVIHAKVSPAHESPTVTSTSSSTAPSLHKSSASAIPAAETASGQKLYEAAIKAHRRDDYRTALELFDRFLTSNPGSPLAADANLYKAECYLKLSAQ